ncbi:hypothetical protein KKI98_01415 [Xenorhabdus bovienii]|nr:hypothetical protein [Xenorhabdus bovienii]
MTVTESVLSEASPKNIGCLLKRRNLSFLPTEAAVRPVRDRQWPVKWEASSVRVESSHL